MMACRDAYEMTIHDKTQPEDKVLPEKTAAESTSVKRLLFGIDSAVSANTVLQNNLTEFEWAVRNKVYPNFWGRNLTGENSLTKEEVDFLHQQGCKVTATDKSEGPMETEEEGLLQAKKTVAAAMKLEIPAGAVIFLKIAADTTVTTVYMKGYALGLLSEGYTPGFQANTDAAYSFDREFSRGLQTDRDVFEKCLVWAIAPSLEEYDRITTTHLIHPDNWAPYAPSGITRNDIALWQYGKDCHPIQDNTGRETVFNIDLLRNEKIIIDKMF